VTLNQPSLGGASVGFAERLLEVIDSGRRTATYKLVAIENLVLADRRCNNDKRDLLPGPPHVTAWARRNQRHGTTLAGLATDSRWDTDPMATVAVARSIYSHLPPGSTPLWLGFKDVDNADPAAALAALA
jgi:hypothetical protein